MDQFSFPQASSPQPTPPTQLPPFSEQTKTLTTPHTKTPAVRGARACTVCRQAKMKCVGGDDSIGQPCQRCERNSTACVFQQHRRGRKPGSKLSEASKMLRRLEKGLSMAKNKSKEASSSSLPAASRTSGGRYYSGGSSSPGSPRQSRDVSPFGATAPSNYRSDVDGYQSDGDEDEDGGEEHSMYPASLIKQEDHLHSSYFKTILNPNQADRASERPGEGLPRGGPQTGWSLTVGSSASELRDPVTLGILDDSTVQSFFDMFFLRLNPFINLFDPALHSAPYVRARCPFLYTTLIMACCKFFKPELYPQIQTLAHTYAVRAFAEGWTRIEVVQAFACLIYWKEPGDTSTWTYIGYACRMAVELGLNCAPTPPQGESEGARRERRNRERTYLALFMHDRLLAMQTGKQWMLPEDELVRRAGAWHEEGGAAASQEDVVVAAMVQLHRVADASAELFVHPELYRPPPNQTEVLRTTNDKLDHWVTFWNNEMQKAGGESFHFAVLRFAQLQARLFLNSFGINQAIASSSRIAPNLDALDKCYNSAVESMKIISNEFSVMSMLPYAQDCVTTGTAYSAAFLMKLLRSSNISGDLKAGATGEIQGVIADAADAYHRASSLPSTSSSAGYHARFLRALISKDASKPRQRRHSDGRSRALQPPYHRAQNSAPQVPTSSYPSYDAPSQPSYSNQLQPMLLQEQGTQSGGYARYQLTPPTPSAHSSSRSTASTHYAHSAPGSDPSALYWRGMLGDMSYPNDGYATAHVPSSTPVDGGYGGYRAALPAPAGLASQQQPHGYLAPEAGFPQPYASRTAAYHPSAFGSMGR